LCCVEQERYFTDAFGFPVVESEFPIIENKLPVIEENKLPLDISFDVQAQSTQVNIYNEGLSVIEPPVIPVLPTQLILPHTFTLDELNRAADHRPEIPESLIAHGVATGRTRRTILWEQNIPNTLVQLPIHHHHHHRSTRVKSLYRLPNGTKYWKTILNMNIA